MNLAQLITTLVGGVGFFLLGMAILTEGLKQIAGPALHQGLLSATKTPWRGLMSGLVVTAVVQSSSAVTLATIGFVNAGLMSLGQALWVIFGANVGTTMTGWLVALIGLKFKVEALALPLIGIGAFLHFASPRQRLAHLGSALAGFGLLFFGIEVLKNGFTELATTVTLPLGEGLTALLLQIGAGVLLTVLMQSSSAALAVVLTAAQGGVLSAQSAAAVVIGANIGTTSTALLAAIGATASAKRAALAHVLFNVVAAVVALLLLPWLVTTVGLLRHALDLPESPAVQVALFHTLFNVLGVAVIWPLVPWLTRILGRSFQSAEEDEARPRYLDRTILPVAELAIKALLQENRRLLTMAVRLVRLAFSGKDRAALPQQYALVAQLAVAIAEFVTQLHQQTLSAEAVERLPKVLRTARYGETAAELAQQAADCWQRIMAVVLPQASSFAQAAEELLAAIDQGQEAAKVKALAQQMEASYQQLKESLLQAGARGEMTVMEMDEQLTAASQLRRALQQVVKGAELLQELAS